MRWQHGRMNSWINTIVSEHSWRLSYGRDRFHQKKPTNQGNPIFLNDTPVKANEEFEDVVEHLEDLISLGEI